MEVRDSQYLSEKELESGPIVNATKRGGGW